MADPDNHRPALVAIASRTGERIDECFGRAASYRIYEADAGGGYRLAEVRPGLSPCEDRRHDLGRLAETAELLSDCGLVLAGRIGPGAMRALAGLGVAALPVGDMEVEEALIRLSRQAAAKRTAPGKTGAGGAGERTAHEEK